MPDVHRDSPAVAGHLRRIPPDVCERLLANAEQVPLGELIDPERAGEWLGDRLFPPAGPRCECGEPPPDLRRFWVGRPQPCSCGRRWSGWRIGGPFEGSPLTSGDVMALLLGLALSRPPATIAAWAGTCPRSARHWIARFGQTPGRRGRPRLLTLEAAAVLQTIEEPERAREVTTP